MSKLNHCDIIKRLTRSFLSSSSNNILMCEGISDGFYGTITDLHLDFETQCYELPCSENATVGMAISASAYEVTTIVCFQRVEFALLAIEQFANNASKGSYLSNELRRNPCLFRFVIGRGWGQGPSHSQSFETVFAQIPEITVIMPVYPNDSQLTFDLFRHLKTPTISLEHRWTHYSVDTSESVRNTKVESYVAIEGFDLSLVAYSFNVLLSVRLASLMNNYGISIEVINLFCISKLNMACIYKSIEKTRNLLIVDSDDRNFGVGSQVLSSLILEKPMLTSQTKRIKRLCNKGIYSPSSPTLSNDYYLKISDLAKEIFNIINIDTLTKEKIINECYAIEGLRPHDVPSQSFSGPF